MLKSRSLYLIGKCLKNLLRKPITGTSHFRLVPESLTTSPGRPVVNYGCTSESWYAGEAVRDHQSQKAKIKISRKFIVLHFDTNPSRIGFKFFQIWGNIIFTLFTGRMKLMTLQCVTPYKCGCTPLRLQLTDWATSILQISAKLQIFG
eukprot:sb/3473703/